MLSGIIKVIIIVAIVGVLGVVVGPCVYYNFLEKPETGQLEMPEIDEATHSVHIENTGGFILTSDYEQHGESVGSRLFILHGFWEMRGNKFKFVAGDVVLDENIFGKITVKKRIK